ncbi:iron chelate uptake ABC transporter family permease subunit [Marinomonas transparens]|uniref:Iron chelate uptake ABC transporter family permease subunit n=1 Tax=Marinomonas transparens TaxID=2795388 RepID=A0A934JU45_9GAMM|nr:iron chelate uptake ABC transporter family permease subunit [Marinomonas transparens]MBJ7538337.1 iron chelate uptake ABC transporter family permease subunit [Marinomonas transparens]
MNSVRAVVARSLSNPVYRLMMAGVFAALAIVAFLTLNVRASWAFTLPFRGEKVIAIMLVGVAIAFSTVLFQTLTHNRILTPGIMGFDSLYALLQSFMLLLLGRIAFVQLNPQLKWLIEVMVMAGALCGLYYWLFLRQKRDLPVLILVGIVLGLLFRSLNSLIGRMMDPVEFDVLQDLMFANFNRIDGSLLAVAGFLMLLVSAWLWRQRYVLDVLQLGDAIAVNLGLNQRALTLKLIVAIAFLVSISTALVGPVTFFGILVANIAYAVSGSYQHRFVIPMASFLAIIALVGGQAILEYVLKFGSSLSIVVEFIGGVFFLGLVMRQGRR